MTPCSVRCGAIALALALTASPLVAQTTTGTIRGRVTDAADDPTISAVASKRLKEMLAFTELADRWFVQMLGVPRPRLVALMRLGEKIINLLPMGKAK